MYHFFITAGKVILYILFVQLLVYITSYFIEKRNYYHLKSDKLSDSINYCEDPIVDRCESSTSILNFCSTLIDIEISNILTKQARLLKKYELKLIDQDIEEISKRIFSALKKEILTHKEILLTSEYLNYYIINTVTNKLLIKTKEFNDQLSGV